MAQKFWGRISLIEPARWLHFSVRLVSAAKKGRKSAALRQPLRNSIPF